MCLDAHKDVRCLDAYNQIVVTQFLDHMYLIKGTLHKPLCGHTAVLLHKILLQRTAVDSHTDWHLVFLCLVHNHLHPIPTADVAWIDTDLIRSVFYGSDGKPVVKVNIRHQRNVNLFLNLTKRLCGLHRRNRTPDDLASCLFQSENLVDRSPYIFRLRICHGLDGNWIAASDLYISNLNYFRLSSQHDLPPLHE